MNTSMKILIAYDGSTCANDALNDLCRAGLPPEADALIVSVSEIRMHEQHDDDESEGGITEVATMTPRRMRARDGINDARNMAKIAARRVGEWFPGWNIETKVYAESPAWGVLEAADEMKPDLIVVGSHGLGALGQLLLGSVSQKVLAEAHCSVRIARHHSTVDGSPVRIIIGVDGTPDSDRAVRQVAARTWPPGSAVRVIAAHNPVATFVPPLGSYMSMSLQAAMGQQQEMLARAAENGAKLLRSTGIPVTDEVIEGSPKSVLIDSALEWGADAIFVGAQGHGAFTRVILGSVSAAVAAQAECSVEVVRAQTRRLADI